ncbi:MAG: PilZ domain-containing protein [Deltaproteobacteria bacterium]|nr:PilZ domain-containing protein [Deltaproteobacteria bacterium]
MTEDERQSERHQVRFKLVYDDGNTFNAGSVADVSEGGIFLETALPLPIGTVVRLTPLDPAAGQLFEVEARVARVIAYDQTTGERSGMGLQFQNLSDAERKRVTELILALERRAAEFSGERDPFLGVHLPATPTTQPHTLGRNSGEANK